MKYIIFALAWVILVTLCHIANQSTWSAHDYMLLTILTIWSWLNVYFTDWTMFPNDTPDSITDSLPPPTRPKTLYGVDLEKYTYLGRTSGDKMHPLALGEVAFFRAKDDDMVRIYRIVATTDKDKHRIEKSYFVTIQLPLWMTGEIDHTAIIHMPSSGLRVLYPRYDFDYKQQRWTLKVIAPKPS